MNRLLNKTEMKHMQTKQINIHIHTNAMHKAKTTKTKKKNIQRQTKQ